MEWRISFFVEEAERTATGWRVVGEAGLGPPAVGDEFTFVHHRDVEQDEELILRVERIGTNELSVWTSQEAVLRKGDILGGEVDRRP